MKRKQLEFVEIDKAYLMREFCFDYLNNEAEVPKLQGNIKLLNAITWRLVVQPGFDVNDCFFDPLIEYFEMSVNGGFLAEFDSVSVPDEFTTMLWLQALLAMPKGGAKVKKIMAQLVKAALHGL